MREIKDEDLPKALRHLPRFIISPRRPTTRDEAKRTDIEWGISSLADLYKALDRRFGS